MLSGARGRHTAAARNMISIASRSWSSASYLSAYQRCNHTPERFIAPIDAIADHVEMTDAQKRALSYL